MPLQIHSSRLQQYTEKMFWKATLGQRVARSQIRRLKYMLSFRPQGV